MNFRTAISPLEGMRGLVRHDKPLMLVGSCFTDNIGQCLVSELFDAYINPFGPLYNPLSLHTAFEVLASGREVAETELIESHGNIHSFLFHSRFSGSCREEALGKMNSSIRENAAALTRADIVIVTLGTTRVFSLRATGETVGNCHKLPASHFESRYLTLEETTDALKGILQIIRKVNPTARIIFTVSPLRYTEQGLHGNQIAKSTLLLGIDNAVRTDTTGLAGYFPAYEIMMDDLRDYRFYSEDMKHPTPQAVRYIYEVFKSSYCDKATVELADEAATLTRRLAHRSLSASPEAIALENVEKERLIKNFIARHPQLHHALKRYINITTDNGI